MTWNPETRWDIQDLFEEYSTQLRPTRVSLDFEEFREWGTRFFVPHTSDHERRKENADFDPASWEKYKADNSARVRAWQKRNPEKKNAVMRAYRARHRERLKAEAQTPEARAKKAQKMREHRARKKLEQCVQNPSSTSSPAPSSSTV